MQQALETPLSPPIFPSREALLEHVKTISFAEGYATSIRDSKPDKYVVIACDRGGAYRNRVNVSLEERKRKSSSRLVNCPFQLKGSKQNDGLWILKVKNREHNHEMSSDVSGHPSFRRLSEDEYTRVKQMTMAGIPPRQMITSLRQDNPNLLAINRTMYAAKAKIRKEDLGGRTPIEALFDELSKGGFTHDIKHDGENRLTHLFFAHPLSIILSKSYPNIFVMDCTYKTNKFKMSLLDIIGVTSFNTSFYSSCVFLRNEGEEDYIWALEMFKKMLGATLECMVIVTDRELALMNAIEVVFPTAKHLLCIWHIEKNILAKCKSHFEEGEDWPNFLYSWTKVTQSPTEVAFNDAWKEFEDVYKAKPFAIDYIKKSWLPFKERFIKAWSDKHLHFGNHASSRAEGGHATLKRYLEVSTGNLHEVTRKICLAIENNFLEVKTQLAREKINVPHSICVPIFRDLFHHVSIYALDKLFKQYKLASSGTSSPMCKSHFYASMGLPCMHMMRKMNRGLQLSDIHSQWHLNGRCFESTPIDKEDEFKALLQQLEMKYKEWPISQKEAALEKISQLVNAPNLVIFDPIIQPHKGRPHGSKSKKALTTTTREPSSFEIMESARKCTICRGVGHNRLRCPQNVEADPHFVVPNVVEREAFDLNSTPDDIHGFL